MTLNAPAAVAIGDLGDPYPLHTPEFAADPYAAYEAMRLRFGPLAPVLLHPGVSATLVLGYREAVHILHATDKFSADPTRWVTGGGLPRGCPIAPMIGPRRNSLRTGGTAHDRYRAATVAALSGIDDLMVRDLIAERSVALVNGFCRRGRADLLTDYITPLVFEVICQILGCPPALGAMVAQASAAMFDGIDTGAVDDMLTTALGRLIALRRHSPGQDVTTRFLNHSARLTDRELIDQLLTVFAAGSEPLVNLIANALLLILRDPDFTGRDGRHGEPTGAAIARVLSQDPPMANYCITYPRAPTQLDVIRTFPHTRRVTIALPPHQPVVVSMAAAATDPTIAAGERELARSAWNLGWGTGPHACPDPARTLSQHVAAEAIDHLLDYMPDLHLIGQPHWRPGPFHRALAELPVTFDPRPPFPAPHDRKQ
ncbi:cytochrome P450 [Nocardia takedensis]|uniref:hypothetical protein n=1 Tax=Nocardia takedensis TaxID=259390 RepID=UPI0002D8A92F